MTFCLLSTPPFSRSHPFLFLLRDDTSRERDAVEGVLLSCCGCESNRKENFTIVQVCVCARVIVFVDFFGKCGGGGTMPWVLAAPYDDKFIVYIVTNFH